MWFAIHVKPGAEQDALKLLQAGAQGAELQELFCPMSTIESTVNGQAAEDEQPLIPGCVIAIAPSKREVRKFLRRNDSIEPLLATSPSFSELTDNEIAFIDKLTRPGQRTVEMSEGIVEKGRIRVIQGPLTGLEQDIEHYHRRKRRATLKTSIAGTPIEAQVGLRVTGTHPPVLSQA